MAEQQTFTIKLMTLTRFADVITLASTRTPDPLAAGIERFVVLEHIEPENLP